MLENIYEAKLLQPATAFANAKILLKRFISHVITTRKTLLKIEF